MQPDPHLRSSALELIAERARNDSRPERRLRGDELLRADESDWRSKVLAGERKTPGIPRDPACCVAGRVGRVLNRPLEVLTVPPRWKVGFAAACVCEGMRSMKAPA